MPHIVKDILTGSAILISGIIISFAVFIILLFLWIFLHILGAFVWIFFIVFLFLAGIWTIGYTYRKIKEKKGDV